MAMLTIGSAELWKEGIVFRGEQFQASQLRFSQVQIASKMLIIPRAKGSDGQHELFHGQRHAMGRDVLIAKCSNERIVVDLIRFELRHDSIQSFIHFKGVLDGEEALVA